METMARWKPIDSKRGGYFWLLCNWPGCGRRLGQVEPDPDPIDLADLTIVAYSPTAAEDYRPDRAGVYALKAGRRNLHGESRPSRNGQHQHPTPQHVRRDRPVERLFGALEGTVVSGPFAREIRHHRANPDNRSLPARGYLDLPAAVRCPDCGVINRLAVPDDYETIVHPERGLLVRKIASPNTRQ